MKRILILPALLAVLSCQSPPKAVAPVGEQFTEGEQTKLAAAIRPKPNEDDFDKIPWLVSIHEARIKAAKEGKPILLWEMDGHPLGCG